MTRVRDSAGAEDAGALRRIPFDASSVAAILAAVVSFCYLAGWGHLRTYFEAMGLWQVVESDIPAAVVLSSAWWPVAMTLAVHHPVILWPNHDFDTQAKPYLSTSALAAVMVLLSGEEWILPGWTSWVWSQLSFLLCGRVGVCLLLFGRWSRWASIAAGLFLLLVAVPGASGRATAARHLMVPGKNFPIVRLADGTQFYLPFASGDRLYAYAVGEREPQHSFRILDVATPGTRIIPRFREPFPRSLVFWQ